MKKKWSLFLPMLLFGYFIVFGANVSGEQAMLTIIFLLMFNKWAIVDD